MQKQAACPLQAYRSRSHHLTRIMRLSFVWILGTVCIAVSSMPVSEDAIACPMLCNSFIDCCLGHDCLSIYIPSSVSMSRFLCRIALLTYFVGTSHKCVSNSGVRRVCSAEDLIMLTVLIASFWDRLHRMRQA